jgi:hypothetical protein
MDVLDRQILLAYAATKAVETDINNPFSGVIPIFQVLAKQFAGKPFNASDASQELAKSFGLEAPHDLIQYWMADLVKNNIVSSTAAKTDAGTVYYWTREFENASVGENFKASLDRVLGAFDRFKQSQNELHIHAYTSDQFYTLLRQGIISGMFSEEFRAPRVKSEEEYIFGRFVEYLEDTDTESLGILSEMRGAVIISDLIVHAWSPQKKAPDLRTMSVYLDSPTTMDALGLAGVERKRYALTLIELLKSCKADVLIADVHVQEIASNIRGLLKLPSNQRYGPTYIAILKGEVDDDLLQVTVGNLDSAVEALGIKVDDNFENHLRRSPIQGESRETLFARLQSMYQKSDALERDLDVIAGVLSRRGPKNPVRLEKALSVFVTNNDRLSGYVNRYMADAFGYKWDNVQLVITRRNMTGMLAFCLGVKKSKEVSQEELLLVASNAAAINPDIVRKIQSHVANLNHARSGELIQLLRMPNISRIAMDRTHGQVANATEGITREIIERAMETLREEAKGEVEQRFRSANTRLRNQADEMRLQVEEETRNREFAAQEADRRLHVERERASAELAATKRSQVQDRLRQLERTQQQYEAWMDARRSVGSGFSIVAFAAAALVATLTFYTTLTSIQEMLWKVLVALALGLAVLVPLFATPLKRRVQDILCSSQQRVFVEAARLIGLKEADRSEEGLARVKKDLEAQL